MTEPLTPIERSKKRAFSIAASEGIGLGVSFAALGMAKAALGEKRMEQVKHWVAEKIVLRFIHKADEAGLPIAQPNAEDATREKAFTPMTPEDRARKIAGSVVDLSLMVPVGIAARLAAQKKMDDHFGAQTPMGHYVFSRVVDNTVGAATLVGLNTVAREPAKAATHTLSGVLKKIGLKEETADSVAKFAVYAQTPNLTGMAANLATLHGMDKRGR